jgi:alpha-ketoglutaric semialdehyde dehydrogenase
MSSVNPVVLLPRALEERAEKLAAEFVASLTLGAGQFCTNPGLVLAVNSRGLDRFLDAASAAVETASASVMLTPGHHEAYAAGMARRAGWPDVDILAQGARGEGANLCRATLFTVPDAVFAAREEELSRELFGASSIIVRCRDVGVLARTLERLEGQLTATIHWSRGDETTMRTLLPVLEDKAGRLVANGWPTGVEVCHAMVHGGPFPATSDSRTTSVGTLAMERFLRPICYQGFADALLPAELRSDAPGGKLRRVDGAWTLS